MRKHEKERERERENYPASRSFNHQSLHSSILETAFDVHEYRKLGFPFTGCPVSSSSRRERVHPGRGIRLVFPFERKFKYTVALLFHRRGAGYVKEVGGEEGGVWRKQQRRKSGNRGACASPVVVRGKRREPVMGTLIEQFAHVPWNSRNLLRRLTMYRIPACGAALRMNRADRLD